MNYIKDFSDFVNEKRDWNSKKPGPDGYHTGLTDKQVKRKEAQMKRQAKMDDDDPDAYKKMPGDNREKQDGLKKKSKHTVLYHKKYGRLITERGKKATGDRSPIKNKKIEKALSKKSKQTGVPIELIRIVMRRGMAAWKSGHRPGAGQEQWGYARVNSFLTKQPGTWGGADKDVAREVRAGGHDKKLK